MDKCTGPRYPNEFYNLVSIENWHGKYGHLNVVKLDHDSECTGFGKHNRIVNYGDFTGRIDKVWGLRNPTEKEIVRYYKKEWDRKGKYNAVLVSEDEKSIYFKLLTNRKGKNIMTYIYRQLTTSDITQALCNDGYASWHKNYEACKAIAEYLESLAEDTGEAIELDIVAIRCEFRLMDDIADFNNQYDKECETLDDIREFTQVIEIDNSDLFIIQDF